MKIDRKVLGMVVDTKAPGENSIHALSDTKLVDP